MARDVSHLHYQDAARAINYMGNLMSHLQGDIQHSVGSNDPLTANYYKLGQAASDLWGVAAKMNNTAVFDNIKYSVSVSNARAAAAGLMQNGRYREEHGGLTDAYMRAFNQVDSDLSNVLSNGMSASMNGTSYGSEEISADKLMEAAKNAEPMEQRAAFKR